MIPLKAIVQVWSNGSGLGVLQYEKYSGVKHGWNLWLSKFIINPRVQWNLAKSLTLELESYNYFLFFSIPMEGLLSAEIHRKCFLEKKWELKMLYKLYDIKCFSIHFDGKSQSQMTPPMKGGWFRLHSSFCWIVFIHTQQWYLTLQNHFFYILK